MGKNKKKNKNSATSNVASTSFKDVKSSIDSNQINNQDEIKVKSSEEESRSLKNVSQKRDMDSCLLAFCLARDHNQPKYHARTQRYIIENFDDAVREPKFYEQLSKDDILVFLQAEDLIVSCEEVVYHMVIRWVKHKFPERLKYLDELLELVRFPQLDFDFLRQQVGGESIVLDSGVGRMLLREALEYHTNILAKDNSQNA